MANFKSRIVLPLLLGLLTLGASAQTVDAVNHTLTETSYVHTDSPVSDIQTTVDKNYSDQNSPDQDPESTQTLNQQPIVAKNPGAAPATTPLSGNDRQKSRPRNLFDHLDVDVSVGTTGIGANLSLPVTDWARVRVGFDYMPRTCIPMKFNLMAYAGDDNTMDQDTKFDRMAELLNQFTGFEVDREISTNAKGTMADFRFMVDVFPLKNNRHFYGTVGFLWGSSKVGHIENNIREAPSLVGVMIYNRMYDYFYNYGYYDPEPVFGNFYIDPMMGEAMREKFARYGRVGAHLGNFANGQPYLMEPNKDGMVQADMYVNRFKPYLGLGYTTRMGKDKRWGLSIDLGAMFWGKPRILTHEQYMHKIDSDGYIVDDGIVRYGTYDPDDTHNIYGDYINVATDVEDIGGRVGEYVRLARSVKVYPVATLSISYRLF